MNKFNEVNINIKKALMTSISIELKESNGVKTPDISIRGSLLTQQNKPVSEFWFNNSSYISDEKKIEIPENVHFLIMDIFSQLTPVIYQKLNDTYKQIGEIEKVNQQEAEIVEEEIPF